jgi:hypothetical protein
MNANIVDNLAKGNFTAKGFWRETSADVSLAKPFGQKGREQ